jgi:hypothetical protein
MISDEIWSMLENTAVIDSISRNHVEQELLANRAQLFASRSAAMITELWQRDGEMDCLHVWLAGPDLRGLLDMRPKVEEQAHQWGCKRVTLKGRKGWERVLKTFGYVVRDDQLEKML